VREQWPDGARAAVTLTFDGGYLSSYERALPLLADRGMPSTWFLVSDAIGSELEGRPVAPVEAWSDADPSLVEVGNHSRSHPLVRRSAGEIVARALRSPGAIARGARRAATAGTEDGSLSPSEARVSLVSAAEDFAAGKASLERTLARPVPAFAYPNGRARRDLVRAVARMGHRSARTSRPGWNDPARLARFALRAQTWTRETRDEEADAWLAQTVRSGAWLVEVLHVVDDGGDFPWTTSPSQLARHLDDLATAGVWVAMQSDVVDHLCPDPGARPSDGGERAG
jgi:peptidoglycan/xylan/chitin deacetylase (PgdA/CDA1 family)